MKKIFTLLLAVMATVGASAQTNKEWNFSDEQWTSQKYANVTTIDGLTIYGASGKEITIEGNSQTVDGVSYTKRLKFGGTGAFDSTTGEPTSRVLAFDVSGNCDIYIISATAKSNEARGLKIDIKATDKDKENIGTITANTISAQTVTNTKGAGTIYVYSSKSGINLYDIKVTYASAPTATIGTSGYATFCPTTSCKTPSGLTAYTAAYNAATGMVDLTAVADGIIPAKVGVILKGAAKDYTMEAAETTATAIEGNELIGLTEAKTVADADNAFILVNDGGTVKFGKTTTGTTIAAGKAYLPIADGNAAKSISMNLGDATAINTVATEKNADNAFYTLSGMKTASPVKGMLYIHNGKKFIAK